MGRQLPLRSLLAFIFLELTSMSASSSARDRRTVHCEVFKSSPALCVALDMVVEIFIGALGHRGKRAKIERLSLVGGRDRDGRKKVTTSRTCRSWHRLRQDKTRFHRSRCIDTCFQSCMDVLKILTDGNRRKGMGMSGVDYCNSGEKTRVSSAEDLHRITLIIDRCGFVT